MSFRVALQGVPAKQLEGKLNGDSKGPEKTEEAALYNYARTDRMHALRSVFVAQPTQGLGGCSFNHWCMQLRFCSGSSCQ